ncbi:MAG: AAA family ATPase [Candidatus Diapherotrites archaeon]
MIKRIVIENWRSHKKTELEFDRGSNVLIGRMGAGKSSVLNALCFALFGTFPELQRRETTMESIVMNRPSKQEYAKVTLEFSFDNKEYLVERVVYCGSKTNEAKLYCNGKLIAGPKVSDVNSETEKILGIDYELFSRAMYAEQNHIDYILKLSPNERKLRFDQLLDLEKYEKVRKNAVTLRNNIKAVLDEKKISLSEMKALFSEAKYLELKEETVKLNKEIEEKIALLKDAEKKVEEAKVEMSKLIEKQRKYNELKDRSAKLSGNIENLKSNLERAEKALGKKIGELNRESAEKKLSEIEKEQKELSEKYEELNEIKAKIREKNVKIQGLKDENSRLLKALPKDAIEPEKIEAKIRETENEISRVKEKIDILKKRRAKIESELSRVREKIEIEKNKIGDNEEKIKLLSKAKAVCPTCNQKLTEEHRKELMNEFQKAIAECNSVIKNLEDATKKLLEEITLSEEETEKLQRKQEELIEIKASFRGLAEKATRIKENNNALSVLQKELLDLEAREKDLGNVKEKLEAKTKELELARIELDAISNIETLITYENELQKISEEISTLKFDETKALDIKAEFERKNAEIRNIKTQLDSLKNILSEKRQRIEEMEKRAEQIKATEEKIKVAEVITDKLLLFINSLRSTQQELREALIDAINQAMKQLWANVYPYGDYSDIKLSTGETYELMVKSNGDWVPVQGTLSGGESSVAALVLRISTSLVLARNLRVLILDEPTHNLDERTIGVLSQLIRDVLPKFVDQIFLITHEKGMEKAASATLYLLSKDDEHGNITKAELISLRD